MLQRLAATGRVPSQQLVADTRMRHACRCIIAVPHCCAVAEGPSALPAAPCLPNSILNNGSPGSRWLSCALSCIQDARMHTCKQTAHLSGENGVWLARLQLILSPVDVVAQEQIVCQHQVSARVARTPKSVELRSEREQTRQTVAIYVTGHRAPR